MAEKIAVIGLGNMGHALATTLVSSGRAVTVWNRTASKAAPLVAAGATQAHTPAEAIAGSELVIVCVGNYDDTRLVLQDCPDLSGHTLIQLTTGTAEQAENLRASVVERGGDYLDGVILAYPSGIGLANTTIAVAGSDVAWARSKAVLQTLGGASLYTGGNLAAPVALEVALVGPSLLATIAAIQGAHLLRKAGMDISAYAEMLQGGSDFLTGSLVRQVRAILEDRFDEPEAALETWAAGVEHIANSLGDSQIDLFGPVRTLLRRAVAAGHGRKELAAVVKVLD